MKLCPWCNEEVKADEGSIRIPRMEQAGILTAWSVDSWHRECVIRNVIGSVAHQRGLCSCNGDHTAELEAIGRTKREDAQAALRYYREQHPRD